MATGGQTLIKSNDFKNWLKVGLALNYMNESLHSFIEEEVNALHQYLTSKANSGPPCENCSSKNIIRNKETGTWAFYPPCPSLICDNWMRLLLSLHKHPTSENIFWDNCDIKAWPSSPWECAKMYMCRGQQPSNKGSATSDPQANLTLMSRCTYFHQKNGKLSVQGPYQAEVVLGIRNRFAHAERMKFTETEMTNSIKEIIQLLEDPIHLFFRKECAAAVKDIQKVYTDEIDIFLNPDMETRIKGKILNDFRHELSGRKKNMGNTALEQLRCQMQQQYMDITRQIGILSKDLKNVSRLLDLKTSRHVKQTEDMEKQVIYKRQVPANEGTAQQERPGTPALEKETLNWLCMVRLLKEVGPEVFQELFCLQVQTKSLGQYLSISSDLMNHPGQHDYCLNLWNAFHEQLPPDMDKITKKHIKRMFASWTEGPRQKMTLPQQIKRLEKWDSDIQLNLSNSPPNVLDILIQWSRQIRDEMSLLKPLCTIMKELYRDLHNRMKDAQLALFDIINMHHDNALIRCKQRLSTDGDLVNLARNCQSVAREECSQFSPKCIEFFSTLTAQIQEWLISRQQRYEDTPYNRVVTDIVACVCKRYESLRKECQEQLENVCCMWYTDIQEMFANWIVEIMRESNVDRKSVLKTWNDNMQQYPTIREYQLKHFFMGPSVSQVTSQLTKLDIDTSEQMDVLIRSNNNQNIQHFDIGQLATLLQSLPSVCSPEKGWNASEHPDSDLSVGADIARILNWSKDLMTHTSTQRLSDQSFDALWVKIECALCRLACTCGHRFLDNIKTNIHVRIPSLIDQQHDKFNVLSPTHKSRLNTVIETPLQYKKGKRLGRGGYGIVYECFDIKHHRTVAMKTVPRIGSEEDKEEQEAAEKLFNEVLLLRKLSHNRIVQYYSCLEIKDECILCIFMEYMQNGSVQDFMSKNQNPLEPDLAVKLTRQVLEGTTYLHDKDILHRDIKASNVLLDCNMNAKLGDFGVSKELETITQKRTHCKTYVGSPYWMSPERIQGKEYRKSADIWSIGCTVVEMVTTKPPWHELERNQVIFQIGLGKDPVYTLPPRASPHLEQFLCQTFRQIASERPSATDLLNHPFLT